jgi:hypothetical protein
MKITEKVSSEGQKKKKTEYFPYVFNDALTIELNFNGKTRLVCWFLVSDFLVQKVDERQRQGKLHAVTKNRTVVGNSEYIAAYWQTTVDFRRLIKKW